MKDKHTFEANLTWSKLDPGKPSAEKLYEKNHIVQIPGKRDMAISAAKIFKGDPSLHNPEDLLLSSLVSCHMMSYLYVCSQNQIDVVGYSDRAVAILQTFPDGSGKIIEVCLNPEVTIGNPAKIELASALHKEAHKLCFIANSCNFSIQIQPTCNSADCPLSS